MRPPDDRGGGPLGARWRETATRAQLAALPRGRVAISCSAPLGNGGLGRHLQEIVDALQLGGATTSCICGSPSPSARPGAGSGARPARATAHSPGALSRLARPLSPGLRTWAFMAEFDAFAARRLPAAEHLIAFNGQALDQFVAARRRAYTSLELVSANSHLRLVARQHARARRLYPLEGSWTRHLVTRNLREYARADRIHLATRYIRDSFLEEGFPEETLCHLPLTPHLRYQPAVARVPAERFDVVYVGSLAVHKGVPLLIDAFRRLPHRDMRLILVGGWGTRGMRRFVEEACAADARIALRPGDPLPRLHAASLYVHPAYEEGYGYAAAEALACGVPVLVSEDTGMKELIEAPRTGMVLPTGDGRALEEAIDSAYRGELFAR